MLITSYLVRVLNLRLPPFVDKVSFFVDKPLPCVDNSLLNVETAPSYVDNLQVIVDNPIFGSGAYPHLLIKRVFL